MTHDGPLGNAGYAITGSGGGGSGGRYVFASPEELDAITTEWTEIRDDIARDGDRLRQALFVDLKPAEDLMSREQATALIRSLIKAADHNTSMVAYMNAYIAKLAEAREQYAANEESAVTRLGRANEM